MRMMKVVYYDKAMSSRNEKFETRAMEPHLAKGVASALGEMGCHDITIEPVKQAA